MALVAPIGIDTAETTKEASSSMPSKKMEEKIRSINATQIELIGKKVVETVLNRLGPIGKYEAEQLIFEKNKNDQQLSSLSMTALAQYKILADQFIGKKFLSEELVTKLMNDSLQHVSTGLQTSFSTPLAFIKTGLGFFLSSHDPEGFIADAAKQNGLHLNMTHIPMTYRVRLELDEPLTQQHQDLVFAIKELSDIIEFSKITFTVKSSELVLI